MVVHCLSKCDLTVLCRGEHLIVEKGKKKHVIDNRLSFVLKVSPLANYPFLYPLPYKICKRKPPACEEG